MAVHASAPQMFPDLLSAPRKTYECFASSGKPLGASAFCPKCRCPLASRLDTLPCFKTFCIQPPLGIFSPLPSVFVPYMFSNISRKRISARPCLEIVLEKTKPHPTPEVSSIASQNHDPVPRLRFWHKGAPQGPGPAG